MAAQYVNVSLEEMTEFLAARGFQPLNLTRDQDTDIRANEVVFGKFVGRSGNNQPLCLRVYSGIERHGASRDCGKDAIRVVLVTKTRDGKVRVVGSLERCHRVKNWRANVDDRLHRWQECIGPDCPQCEGPMVKRETKKDKTPFWGCCNFPQCKGTRSIPPQGGSKPPSKREMRAEAEIFAIEASQI